MQKRFSLDGMAIEQQTGHPGTVANIYSLAGGYRGQCIDQPRPAAPGFQRQAAPKPESTVHLEGLAAIHRHEAYSPVAQPMHGFARPHDKALAQRRVGAVTCDAEHVIVKLVGAVASEIRHGNLFVGEVGTQGTDIVDTIIDKPDG